MKLSCIFGHKWKGCTCERCGEVGYYVQVIYYDSSVYQGEIPMTVDFLSEDNVKKYAYPRI